MLYGRVAPPASLSAYIECFWFLELAPTAEPQLDHVLPDGRAEMIFHYGKPPLLQDSQGHFVEQGRALFAGQLEASIVLKTHAAASMLSVRFRPAGVSQFFGFPQSELTGRVTELSSVAGHLTRDLIEQVLGDAQNNDQRIKYLVSFFEKRLGYRPLFDLAPLINEIEERGGHTRAAELAARHGLSRRQLERLFKHQVGVSPKTFCKVVRFQRFLSALKQPGVRLLDAGLDCGYYDQSHLIREFKAFAGVAPLAHRGRATKITAFLAGDEDVAFVQSETSKF